jgi:simple sugar transport system permease protein
VLGARARGAAEALAIPAGALGLSLILFGMFVALTGNDPLAVYGTVARGAFGNWFSIQNTLQRSAPLMLTALCTALPAALGLIVIGGEGALIAGALATVAVAAALPSTPPAVVVPAMAVGGAVAGGLWSALPGGLRAYRGVNETIASLLLNYIAIALMNHLVTGPMRDPTVVHRPSSWSVGEGNMIGQVPGMDVHWGLVFGLVACVVTYVLVRHTVFGFAARIVGGNSRAGRMAGLSVGALTLAFCFIGGAAAGLAGAVEVAAVHGRASSSLVVGYGYTGILVAFLARQNPLAVIPVAVLLGGIEASGGLLQRWHDLPDASVQVMRGIIFLVLLASEPFYGHLRGFRARPA